MNDELRLLQKLGDELQPPADQPPAHLRRRVLTGAAPARSRRAPVRLGRLATAVAAVAVALAGFVFAADTHLPRPAPHQREVASPGQVLELAAQQVTLTSNLNARPEQFIHTESLVVRQDISRGGWTRQHNPVLLVRRWQSVDCGRDGLVRERSVEPPETIWRTDRVPACTSDTEALPGDGDSMYRFLYRPAADEIREWQGFDGSPDDLALERATRVLSSGQASPAVQEAVFTALQRIPRFSMRPRAVDVAGRTGVGLVYTGLGGKTELVFDATSYRYLGMNRQLPPQYFQLGRDLSVVVREAVQRVAVVDRVGDLK